jgi:ABC-2 type transport system ATP-binding protein
MLQTGGLLRDVSVRELIGLVAALYDAGRSVDDVLAVAGLESIASQRTQKLSGGQAQRVRFAMTLATDARLLVLDEPTVGLDPLLRRDLWELFARLRDAGATLLVSTHVLDEAGRCDEVVLLREGRLLGRTTAPELRRDTGTDDLDEAFVRLIEREDAAR